MLRDDLMDATLGGGVGSGSSSSDPSLSMSATARQHIYGGIDPEVEDNFFVVESVPNSSLKGGADGERMLPMPTEGFLERGHPPNQAVSLPSKPPTDRCPLIELPPELIDAILAFLTPLELTGLSSVCRTLRQHTLADGVWSAILRAHIPGPAPLTSPYPFGTYHELYRSLETKWFLPKYKIWFCDRDLAGRLIVCRWNQREGRIEGYQLLAISHHDKFHHWAADSGVVIHVFEPRVTLHKSKPALKFYASSSSSSSRSKRGEGKEEEEEKASEPKFQAEVPMVVEENPGALRTNFMLARPLDLSGLDDDGCSEKYRRFPYDHVWPPPAVPSNHRVAGSPVALLGAEGVGLSADDVPTCRAEATSQAFRIRQWIELPGQQHPGSPDSMLGQGLASLMGALTGRPPPSSPPPPPSLGRLGRIMGGVGDQGMPAAGAGMMRTSRVEEDIITYSTLDPVLYTPTETKPWRGIWVGDYSAHGCEFLLITQPDESQPELTDEELGLVRGEWEGEEDWQRRRKEARIYRGRLEAVKLTGDPNVPRGELTFVADDLGENGLVGITQEEPFKGARLVRSRGHIAREGFRCDKYVESQLLLMSTNRLAQYWVGFGHISFFERVDIDQFLDPELH